MALVNPHPALKVAVPMNPMVDGWLGDDWFHNGAFRQTEHADTSSSRKPRATIRRNWWRRTLRRSTTSSCAPARRASSASEHGARPGRLLAQDHRAPAYDAFWQSQAMDKILAAQPLKVPVMLVAQPLGPGGHLRRACGLSRARAEGREQRHGLSVDGAMASRPGDRARQHTRRDPVRTRTPSHWWRRHVLAPFLAHYLKAARRWTLRR